MKVAITGGYGFLGWHLACRLRAARQIEPVRLGRSDFADADRLRDSLKDVDVVYHIGGVNRADTDVEVEVANVRLAERLAAALGGRPVHIVYANSIQAQLDNSYGRGKREASRILRALPGSLADVLFPNLFGEHGRPRYNSFVATFCDAIATGATPTVVDDKQVELLHAQRAAQILIDAADDRNDAMLRPAGESRLVSDVLSQLNAFHGLYYSHGEIPDLSSAFSKDLFNTYRSHLFPAPFPLHPRRFADPRGLLFEAVRVHGGESQSYVSSTVPGHTRGDHYHLHRVERFLVASGEAEIQLRRLLHDQVVTFRVSGDKPAIIDMPTLWVHNIRNVGDSEVITVFWSDQLLNAGCPDQYPERVVLS